MKDFLGRVIHPGDKVFYAHSTQCGGVAFQTFVVKAIKEKRLEVHLQQGFARKGKYIKPENCVVIKPVGSEKEDVVHCEKCEHWDAAFELCDYFNCPREGTDYCSEGRSRSIE